MGPQGPAGADGAGGATYSFAAPLSADAADSVSIDLSAYATKTYVDSAIAAIPNLAGWNSDDSRIDFESRSH